MKKILLSFLSLAVAVAVIGQDNVTIDTDASIVEWKGSKIVGGSHAGELKFNEGVLKMKNGKLVGGEFTIDMTSLNVTDLSGNGKSKLEGHLKSDDFFGVNNYASSKFVISKIGKGKNGLANVTGQLTIKESTEEITFPAAFAIEDGWAAGSASLTFDRSKFDVRYGSGSFFDNLGDKAISDDIEVTVKLKAKVVQM